jgi:DNA-binding response OmpR family regulator
MIHPCTEKDPCRMLLVEDDDSYAEWFLHATVLGDERGFCCDRTETIAGALELISQATMVPYHIIWLDLRLPDAVGLSGLQAIGEETQHRTPIVALTAYASSYDLVELAAAGAQDIVDKSVSIHHSLLLKMARIAIARARLRNERMDLIQNMRDRITELEIARHWCEECHQGAVCALDGDTGTVGELLDGVIEKLRRAAYAGVE